MNRQRGGGCLGILAGLGLIILLLLLLGAFTGYGLGIGIAEYVKTETGDVQIAAGTPPTLNITNQIGSVNLQPSTDGKLTYKVDKHGWSVTSSTAQGEADRMKFSATANGSTVDIKAEQAAGLLRFNVGQQNSMDVTVNVPAGSTVNVTVNAGNANISGADGKLTVTVNAGSITLIDAHLSGPLSLTANAGKIDFRGSLATGSSGNVVQANAGGVTMMLAAASKYNFDVKADVGNINTDFTVPNGKNRAGTGETLVGVTDSGEGTPIPLKVSANAGSITINQLK